ncbi:MAG: S8 family serine peptidase, partial [Candidatus Limnocylindria bacterium]
VLHAVTSEGVRSINADAWHGDGLTGTGTKIAVIDGGFAGYLERQQSGDLPANVAVVDYCGGAFATATSHGTAVAEVVHDVAPGAQLHLICIASTVGFALAKDYAKAQALDVVTVSLGFPFTSRGDGGGGPSTPEGVVADARAAGILWVNAAGNEAESHWHGAFASADGDGYHEFAPTGPEQNRFVMDAGGAVCAYLKWDEWPAARSDYDLELWRESDAARVAVSNTVSVGRAPTEALCYANPGSAAVFGLAIFRAGGTGTPRIDLLATPAALEFATPDGSVVEPATSPGALAVGAVCWQDGRLASYSSRGPTIDGRIKPDLAAATQVSTASRGTFVSCDTLTAGFGGTSASAPHVGGAAALVKQRHPSFRAVELQAFLEGRATDAGEPGKDNLYGSGILTLGSPSACAPGSTATPTMTNHLPNITKTLGGPSGFTTPFVVQNAGTVPTTLEIEFKSFATGQCVWRNTVGGLAPGASFADVPSNDTLLPPDSQFSVVVKSFGAPIVSVVNQHAGTGARSEAMSYVGSAGGSTSVFLPNVVRRFFGFHTPFVMQNLGVETTVATARFVPFDGSGAPVTVTRAIAGGQSRFVEPDSDDPSLGAPGLVDGKQYAVSVTASQPLAVVVNTHNDAPSVAAPVAYSANGIAAGAASVYGPYAAKN